MTRGASQILLVDGDVEYHDIFRDDLDLALKGNDYHLTCHADTAAALGGTIELESAPGGDTGGRVTLPARDFIEAKLAHVLS
jgi:autotransporter translocation and assembly factor TamB